RASSPRPRPNQNVVPRGEFGDKGGEWEDPPTRADASIVDEIAQSSLARRDDQRTFKGAGIDALSQKTLVGAPPADLLHQNFGEETVANAAAMRSLADSPLARDEGMEAQTLTKMPRAETGLTDPDGVAAESKLRDQFDQLVDTKPRRMTPKPHAAVRPFDDVAKIRDDAPTADDMPARRDSTPRPIVRATPPSIPAQSAPPTRPTPKPMSVQAPPPRPSSPALSAAQPAKTKLGVDPASPMLAPPSGARTQPDMRRAQSGSASMTPDVSVSEVLKDLGHRPSRPSMPNMPQAPRSFGSTFLLMLLVLLVAGGAAAVVYFALPYFT
ncbi:MAG TPA: hypothetical protein VL326_29950, partial [Kofleriaceae bacterium]|nr:hypothetical protein [Kofleriaceae bacterium]